MENTVVCSWTNKHFTEPHLRAFTPTRITCGRNYCLVRYIAQNKHSPKSKVLFLLATRQTLSWRNKCDTGICAFTYLIYPLHGMVCLHFLSYTKQLDILRCYHIQTTITSIVQRQGFCVNYSHFATYAPMHTDNIVYLYKL